MYREKGVEDESRGEGKKRRGKKKVNSFRKAKSGITDTREPSSRRIHSSKFVGSAII